MRNVKDLTRDDLKKMGVSRVNLLTAEVWNKKGKLIKPKWNHHYLYIRLYEIDENGKLVHIPDDTKKCGWKYKECKVLLHRLVMI